MPQQVLLRIKKLLGILSSRNYLQALSKGVAAGVEHEPVLKRLAVLTFIDIGANRGQFSIVARKLFPGARIIAFEPLPEPANVFKRVLASKDPLTEIYEKAISPTSEKLIIHVSGKDDSSSVLPIGKLQEDIFPGTAEVDRILVDAGPLSTSVYMEDLEHPILLKIDVQGYELEVLKSFGQSLQQIEYIYVECSFVELYKGQVLVDEIISYLSLKGFHLNLIANLISGVDDTAIQADFLFSSSSNG